MGTGGFVAEYRKAWRELGPYERFEQIVAVLLTVLIAIVIIVSSVRLAIDIAVTFTRDVGSLDDKVFQEVFGRIMTVLIALEFNHSIVQVLQREQHLIQVRNVVLIAILAVARKFIIIDLDTQGAETLIALAVTIVALAAIYWVLGEADRKKSG